MALGSVNVPQDDTTLKAHIKNKENPHGVTKKQIGLGNVPNVATNDQTPTYTQAEKLAALVSGEKMSVSFGKIMKAIADLIAHLANKQNPHGVTAEQVDAAPADHRHRGHSINPTSIELVPGETAGHGGFIDFHYNSASATAVDYTSRIWENREGEINVEGKLKAQDSAVLTGSNVKAVCNTTVSFVDGKATYTDSAITSASMCLVQRRAGQVGYNQSFATTCYNGYVNIFTDDKDPDAAETSESMSLNILIINS